MAEMEDDKICCTPDDANREGTSKLTRFLQVLDPSNAPIDPRSTQDILVFAKRYAELVRYYDFDDTVDCIDEENESNNAQNSNQVAEPYKQGQINTITDQKKLLANGPSVKQKITNWKEFFYNDIAVVIASISQYQNKLWHIKNEYNAIRSETETYPTKENYRKLFLSIVHHLKRVHRWYERSVDGHPLKTELGVKIKSFLVPALKKLVAYDKGMLLNTLDDLDLISQYEGFKDDPWNVDYDKIDLDATIYVGDSLKKKIIYALMYVDDIFNTMYKVYEEITGRSDFYWQQAIENFPSHQPHMALFISFVELFSYAKNELNNLTKRHLEFFYRDVLHLQERPATPDSVYLIYQLAKGVDEFDLKQGTELSAGKDALGKQLVYKTDKDLVLNKAKVKEIKTVFLDKVNPILNIYSAPVANSANGKGEKFKDPETAWSTFGYFEPRGEGDEITGDKAEIGFAIASPMLFLSEGVRKIDFKITSLDSDNLFDPGNFDIYLTGQEGWIELSPNPNFGTGAGKDGYHYLLPTAEKPIVPFNPKIHTGNFSSPYPIAKFIAKSDKTFTNTYFEEYKNFNVDYIIIDVDVTGLADVVLENDDGPLNPKKPFYPFTSRPVVGSSVYIGAEEFSEKTIKTFTVNIDYSGQTDFDRRYVGYVDFALPVPNGTTILDNISTNKRRDFNQYTADLSIFQNNAWATADGQTVSLFADGSGSHGSWQIKKPAATVNSGEGLTQILNRVLGQRLQASSNVSDFKKVLSMIALNNLANAIELITGENGIFADPVSAKKAIKQITHDKNNGVKLSTIFKGKIAGTGSVAGDALVTREGGMLYVLTAPEGVAANNYRIFKLTLNNQDFGHEFYPTLISSFISKRKTLELKSAAGATPAVYEIKDLPNTTPPGNDIFIPSTPAEIKVQSISIDYAAEEILNASNSRFFHIYPFGETEVFYSLGKNVPVPPDQITPALFDIAKFNTLLESEEAISQLIIPTPYLLPQFKFGTNNSIVSSLKAANLQVADQHKEFISKNYFRQNQYVSIEQQQGNLYIGIDNLVPPQNLSLLFKFADGTAYDNDNEPPKINWCYLVNNEWIPLPQDHLISDGTYGFQTTGIILIDFPVDATNNNTIVTNGLHWLCASIDSNADRIPKLIDIIAQANQATFYDQQNDPMHYKDPLPEKKISKPLVKIPEVKVIEQPFESFDGKLVEEGNQFYQRASERLRHKGRAITPRDYEHLVLEQFPSVYKVKILSHTDPRCLCRHENPAIPGTNDCCCPQVAPGHVLVIPISNLRNKNAIDILKPRTERRTLLKIVEFLQKRVSPFVRVNAKNPKFEEVKVSFSVKFYTGIDKGFYKRQLNEDLVHYLTPWAYDSNFEILFGNKIYASKIINFIEELPYVDYITCFRMIHIIEGCCKDDSLPDMDCDEMQTDLAIVINHIMVLQAITAPTADERNEKIRLENFYNRFINEVSATSSQAILVSAKQHCINLIEEEPVDDDCNCVKATAKQHLSKINGIK